MIYMHHFMHLAAEVKQIDAFIFKMGNALSAFISQVIQLSQNWSPNIWRTLDILLKLNTLKYRWQKAVEISDFKYSKDNRLQ